MQLIRIGYNHNTGRKFGNLIVVLKNSVPARKLKCPSSAWHRTFIARARYPKNSSLNSSLILHSIKKTLPTCPFKWYSCCSSVSSAHLIWLIKSNSAVRSGNFSPISIFKFFVSILNTSISNASRFSTLTSRGLPINRLIGLSRSFSLIGLGFGHLIFWTKYLA